MTAAYLTVAGWWGFLCYKHKEDILPIQVRFGAKSGLRGLGS